MDISQLFETAKDLPLEPGVYIMYNIKNVVIYVGKAKKLRNRVSQYFTALQKHNAKTLQMVTHVDHFEVILARSEFEALVLENELIKRHKPKYNILLKDDKGYPYIRIDEHCEYPHMELASRLKKDGASYYGPFGSRGATNQLLTALSHALKLPTCTKQFPRDLGKDRPCLNYHMKQCSGWCQLPEKKEAYLQAIGQAEMILQGKYASVAGKLKSQMEEAADNLQFEQAAEYRDYYKAVTSLGEQQLITAGRFSDIDVVGFYELEDRACFTVLHYVAGTLLDKDFEIIDLIGPKDYSELIKQFYIGRAIYPKLILIPEDFEDREVLTEYIRETYHIITHFRIPIRGDYTGFLDIAAKNAKEELERTRSKAEKTNTILHQLQEMIGASKLNRIESYDISHIAGTDIVASMIVFENGTFSKKDYKRFKIEDLDNQDDYMSMRQVLSRRFEHYINQDAGFQEKPDLLLIDGGQNHAAIAEEVLKNYNLDITVCGMVKDNRHRTRALLFADGRTVDIAQNQPVFAMVGRIQEEVHRFAITYHRQLRSKRLNRSELDSIPGIGEKRKEALLKQFKSLKAIKAADFNALKDVVGSKCAENIISYFTMKEGGIDESNKWEMQGSQT